MTDVSYDFLLPNDVEKKENSKLYICFFFLYSPKFCWASCFTILRLWKSTCHRMVWGSQYSLRHCTVAWLAWDGSIMAYRSIQDLQHSLDEMPMTTWQMIPARLVNARTFFPSFLWSACPTCPLLAKPFRTLLGPFMIFHVVPSFYPFFTIMLLTFATIGTQTPWWSWPTPGCPRHVLVLGTGVTMSTWPCKAHILSVHVHVKHGKDHKLFRHASIHPFFHHNFFT